MGKKQLGGVESDGYDSGSDDEADTVYRQKNQARRLVDLASKVDIASSSKDLRGEKDKRISNTRQSKMRKEKPIVLQ